MKREAIKERVTLLESFIDSNLRIEDLIAEKNMGTIVNKRMHCPFHSDSTPSFIVNDKTNQYHCFSCRSAGRYVKLYLEYMQKVEERKVTYFDCLEEILKGNKIEHDVGFYTIFRSLEEMVDLTDITCELRERRKPRPLNSFTLPEEHRLNKALQEFKSDKRTSDSLLDLFAQAQKGVRVNLTNRDSENTQDEEVFATLDDLLNGTW